MEEPEPDVVEDWVPVGAELPDDVPGVEPAFGEPPVLVAGGASVSALSGDSVSGLSVDSASGFSAESGCVLAVEGAGVVEPEDAFGASPCGQE